MRKSNKVRTPYSRGAFLNVLEEEPRVWREQLGRLLKLEGLEHIEIWLEYVPEAADQRKALRELLEPFEVTVHAPFVGLELANHWPELVVTSRQRIEEGLEVATDIGAAVLTIHAGPYADFDNREIVGQRLEQSIGEVVRRAGDDLRVAIENMPERSRVAPGVSPECVGEVRDLVWLGDRIEGLWFTLDVGHAIENGDDYVSFVEDFGERIANVHLHDGHFGGPGHLELGTGELDLRGLTGALEKKGFRGFVALETLSWEATSASWEYWGKVLGGESW